MPAIVRAAPVEVIEMRGTSRGERVWFRPHGLAVTAGTTIRFINRDPGNSHTATAYHPDNFDRTRRIPKAARPWNSDFLLPEESFEVTLTVPGVYDYYCIPHEMAAMVGRIVVGDPGDAGWEGPSTDTEDVSLEVFDALPMVEAILDLGRIEQEGDT
ncbi:cupredoxin domain-containing protein [Primorskyibacter marinus]|uniref:cupredoxin domain-containing protein n=1 Tax=Primorskyibacter marinus TaxID=1977320 RepID=UPI001E5D071B|nr:plastocyanin/azurin family copper-binding protein [Primorskyibacter marinus]